MTLAGRLPSTRWSLVVRAGNSSDDPSIQKTARQSMDELCELYWPALYGYLRRCGRSQQDAEDLIQGFFTQLLERKSIASADETRGRFRAFLYTSLDHYVTNQHRRETAIKRGGQSKTFSIDRSKIDHQDQSILEIDVRSGGEDPAKSFDRQWALWLIRQTLHELKSDYDRRGKQKLFETLSPMLTSTDIDERTRQKIADELGLSATALKVAIHRIRKAYRQRLIDAVANTVADATESGAERQLLFEALGDS